VLDRWRSLRKLGIPLDTLYVHSLGDMVENCDGHYAQQTYTVELSAEEQREYVIAALDQLLEQWAPVAPRLAVYAVPGNHGENRKGGKSFTDFRDNVDVGVWVNLAHAYSKNPERYGHVQIHTPEGMDLSMTYEHDGFVTALAHGHQALGSGDPQKKLDSWWRGQMFGDRPAGDADLLVSGHYHHFRVIQQGPKTHMMCPALCGDQAWFREGMGLTSPPGTLSYVLTGEGWSHLELL
jgi:predicted phosphodiesterase